MALAHDLINGERIEVDRGRDAHDEHIAFDMCGLHLQTSERVEEHFLLVRVLRDGRDVGAAVDHALMDLEQNASLFASCITEGYLTVHCSRHEGAFDATAHAKGVGFVELLWKRFIGHAHGTQPWLG